ncbi:MAG: META domain-containing protein [Geminicoccaceae bacterium]|nr:META domain-containing protein [Geminicoccaceae bacterium]
MPTRLLLLPLLTLLAAVLPPAARADGLPRPFRCGERVIEVTPVGSGLLLLAGFDRHQLVAVPAASGARYEKPGDPATWFHGKGARGLASLAGTPLPECLAEPLRASGNEPFWSVTLDAEALRLERPGEPPRVIAPPPAARIEGRVAVLEAVLDGRPLALRIEAAACRDTMTGMPRPASVTLALGEERLAGCGGDPGSLLRGSAWTVRALDGAALPSARPMELLFATDGRFAGQAPCNRVLGSYRLGGEGLRLGPVASTMMACEEPLMAAERRYVEALERVRGFELSTEGGLALLSDAGARIELRP